MTKKRASVDPPSEAPKVNPMYGSIKCLLKCINHLADIEKASPVDLGAGVEPLTCDFATPVGAIVFLFDVVRRY